MPCPVRCSGTGCGGLTAELAASREHSFPMRDTRLTSQGRDNRRSALLTAFERRIFGVGVLRSHLPGHCLAVGTWAPRPPSGRSTATPRTRQSVPDWALPLPRCWPGSRRSLNAVGRRSKCPDRARMGASDSRCASWRRTSQPCVASTAAADLITHDRSPYTRIPSRWAAPDRWR